MKTILLAVFLDGSQSFIIPVPVLICCVVIGIAFILYQMGVWGQLRKRQILKRDIVAFGTSTRIRPIDEHQTETDYNLDTVEMFIKFIDECLPYANNARLKLLTDLYNDSFQRLIDISGAELVGYQEVRHELLDASSKKLWKMIARKEKELKEVTSGKIQEATAS